MRTKGNALELTCKILWTKFTIPIALPLPPIVFNSADSFSDILLFKGSLRIGDSTFVKLPFVTFCCTPITLFSWKSDHLNLDDRGYIEYQQFDIGFWIIPSEKLTLRIQLHFASSARYVCHPRCTRVVWTSGQVVAWQVPLSTWLENRTGFSQILQRRLLKPSHCPLIVCILFSGRKWNHECIKLKWSSHISECGALYFIKVYTVYEQCSWFCQNFIWVQKNVCE